MSVQPEKQLFDPDLRLNLPPQNNPFRRTHSPMNSPPLAGSPSENRNSNNPFLDPDLVTVNAPKPVQSPTRSPPEAAMRNMSFANRPPPDPRRSSNENGPPAVGQAASRLLQMKPGQIPPGRPSPGRPLPGMGPRPPPGPSELRGPAVPVGSSGLPRQNEPDSERRIRSPSEERRRRERHERRRKEKEAGLKDSQGRPVPNQSGGKSRRNKGPHLDMIDKLDSTGSFLDPLGSGYHVSGPYDATVSRQNRKLRPIDAFAKDSLNMVMGGGKPTYDKHVHADVRNMYGHVDDAVNDYTNAALKTNPNALPGAYRTPRVEGRKMDSFDPTSKIDQVHGDETTGLGTSTFLDGAPAPASAIRESEVQDRDAATAAAAGGLSRTRSLAQRLRGQRGARDRSNSSGVVTSPERRPAPGAPTSASRTISPTGISPGGVSGTLSAGGLQKISESRNPFFEDYNDAYDRKGAAIKDAGADATVEDLGTKPVPAPLTRSVTEGNVGHRRTDSNTSSNGEKEKKEGGLLGRMKSFRGRKKEKTAEPQ